MADASGKWSASLSHDDRAGTKARWFRGLAIVAMISSLGAGLFGGCIVGDDTHEQAPPLGSGGNVTTGTGTHAGGSSGQCTDGETQECHVMLGEHNGVVSCYDGEQVCSDGVWGGCGNGAVTSKRLAPDHTGGEQATVEFPGLEGKGNPSPLSLTDASACIGNPCDPSCQAFLEDPPVDYTIMGTPNSTWFQGGIPLLINNPSWVALGLKTPCSSAADCEFGHYCDFPVTAAPPCAHDVCGVGPALGASCDAKCASKICAADPTCCLPSSSPCVHDVCVTGARLPLGCGDPCVNLVCANKPTCCSTTWDQSCVDLVPVHCGQTCPTWSAACVQKVHDVCGAFCPPAGACAHDKCVTGGPLDQACDPCVATICATTPSCCTTAWTAACATAVASCGQACPLKGQCKPWIPNQLDPNCAGVDITGGIPCLTQIPVCNVGNTTAPAGIPVKYYPSGAGKLPQCSPSGGAPVSCPATSQPISPGHCVNVDCPGLPVDAEIIVNPPGAGHVDECICDNNWAISTGLNCQQPSCTGFDGSKRVKRPEMIVVVDRSSTSLAAADWTKLKAGINAWVPTFTGGNNVASFGLELFPDTVPGACDSAACNTANCGPRVAMNTAPGVNNLMTTTLSPIAQAAAGALAPNAPALAAGYKAVNVYRAAQTVAVQKVTTPIMVYVMTSSPGSCNPSIAALAGQAATEWVNNGTRTFVIGLGVPQSTLDTISQAGGGKSYPLPVGAGLSSTIVHDALKDIRTNTYQCWFDLPGPGLFDAATQTATYFPAAGGNFPIAKVNNAAACSGVPATDTTLQWYLDNPVTPTKQILCPETCKYISANVGNTLQYKLTCPQQFPSPATFTEDYVAVCPSEKQPQWGFLAYDTLALAGTSVDFSIQTGKDLASLGSVVSVATAKSSPVNTQKCLMGGPAPCPIDLYNALAGQPGAVHEQLLHLTIKLNPNIQQSLSPVVQSWQITYSCVDFM